MILSVDLGSTNLKAALFAEGGRRIGETFRPLPYEIRTASRAELSPGAVEACFFAVIAGALSSAGVRAEAIRRVSLTSQAQTFCICEDSGHAISPFFGWTDIRAEKEAGLLQQKLGQTFHEQTGWAEIQPGHMLAKVLWWKDRRGLLENHHIVSLPSYLGMRLGAANVNDRNLAAMSGCYSIPEKTWWTKAIEATGIPARQLGQVVEPGEAVPTRNGSRPRGYSESLEVVFSGNDHTAGAVGCGCRAGRSVLTLGTAGVFYRWAGLHPGPFTADGLWGPYPGGGYYELLHIAHACSALDWADQHLFGRVNTRRFVESAKELESDADAPFFDPNAWGTAAAWSASKAPGEMAYAALEGIAFALRARVGDALHAKEDEIAILGGGGRIDYWVQLLANLFGCPIARPSRDGLDGAAILAGLEISDDRQRPATHRFLPEPSQVARLEKRYRLWRETFSREHPQEEYKINGV